MDNWYIDCEFKISAKNLIYLQLIQNKGAFAPLFFYFKFGYAVIFLRDICNV